MPLLTVSAIGKLFGANTVLADVSFKLEKGEHIALVGANGSGKSTLLRIIAGLETADSGSVSLARNALVTYVSQHARFESSHTLWEAMLETFSAAIEAQKEMRLLEKEMRGDDTPEAVRKEYHRLTTISEHAGYDYESRIERVLVGLELSREQWHQPVSQLSGGQKTRANLARALLQETDLLLLDEPTNHLDIAAIEWLERYLKSVNLAFVVVAHDRYFLERVSKRTMELSSGTVESYPASYLGFLKLREQNRRRTQVTFERQQEQIAATESYVQKYGAGQRSKEAKGRQKRLDRVERLERPKEERALKLRLEKSARKGDSVLRVEGLAAGYEGKAVVRAPDEMVVSHGARVAIVGANGAGKTTLARTLIGELAPVAGRFVWSPGSTPAYYAQSTSTVFNPKQTVLEAFESRFVVGEERARTFLGQFLFEDDDVFKQVVDLSGGERSRLALAALIYSHPNVMLLDEPTNHLDIAAREALEAALAKFGGSLILISHDRFLIDQLATEIWALADGRLTIYDGNWSDYQAGRYRRPLRYSANLASADYPAPAADVDGKGPRASLEAPVRSVALVDGEMATQQNLLAPVLTRGALVASSASLEQLGQMLDEFEKAERELGRLTEELIASRQ